MLTATEYTSTVLEAFKKSGWKRRGKVAWTRGPDADVIVYLQKSNYSETVFVNVGVALHEFGIMDSPKYTNCHIMIRIGHLVDDFPTDMSMDIEDLRAEVQSQEPTLRALGELRELQNRAAAGQLENGLIRKEARPVLFNVH